MKLTLTAKVKIKPAPEQMTRLQQTLQAYRHACNFVSKIVFETKERSKARLHRQTYRELRSTYSLQVANGSVGAPHGVSAILPTPYL